YLFYFAANLVDTLYSDLNPGTELMSRPLEMKMSALDLAPAAAVQGSNRHAAFLDQCCELVAKKGASLMADVIAAVQRYLGLVTTAEAYVATKKSDDVLVGVKLLPNPAASGRAEASGT
ncbi:unnamed protein product, partial [Symbiodinium microadriaticum]